MKAAVTRRGRLVVDNITDPTPGEGHVLTQPLATGICGSDLHALDDFENFVARAKEQGSSDLDASRDTVFGHEFCAEILDYGPGTTKKLPIGTRVCSVPVLFSSRGVEQLGYSHNFPGAMAERMVLQEMLLLPVPDSLSSDLAALTEPLAVGEHAVGLSGIEIGQPALVVGCGPVGLAVIAALKARGHGPVLATDFSPTRRRLAEAFGADIVLDPAEHSPHDRWVDFGVPATLMERTMAEMSGRSAPSPVIFEAVGVPGMLQSLIRDAPPRSRIVVVGVCMHSDRIEPLMAITKEMEFRFSFAYNAGEFATTLDRLGRGIPGADQLITSTVSLDACAHAFELLATPGDHGKIMVRPT